MSSILIYRRLRWRPKLLALWLCLTADLTATGLDLSHVDITSPASDESHGWWSDTTVLVRMPSIDELSLASTWEVAVYDASVGNVLEEKGLMMVPAGIWYARVPANAKTLFRVTDRICVVWLNVQLTEDGLLIDELSRSCTS